MSQIDDFGKIWLRGFLSPEFGVRVDEVYFVIGTGDPKNIQSLIYNNYLIAAIFYPDKKNRVFRRFPLNLVPKSPGTLFNGFTKTKHADINAITYMDSGVDEFICSEKIYFLNNSGEIDPTKIMMLTKWK